MQVDYETKKKMLFESLESAEKNLQGSSLEQTNNDHNFGQYRQQRKRNREDYVDKYKHKDSLFKRPDLPIARCLKSRQRPDYEVRMIVDSEQFALAGLWEKIQYIELHKKSKEFELKMFCITDILKWAEMFVLRQKLPLRVSSISCQLNIIWRLTLNCLEFISMSWDSNKVSCSFFIIQMISLSSILNQLIRFRRRPSFTNFFIILEKSQQVHTLLTRRRFRHLRSDEHISSI